MTPRSRRSDPIEDPNTAAVRIDIDSNHCKLFSALHRYRAKGTIMFGDLNASRGLATAVFESTVDEPNAVMP